MEYQKGEISNMNKEEKIKELEEQRKKALEFIEKRCTYDSHLQGYCMGLTPGEVRTLVLKLGGKKEV